MSLSSLRDYQQQGVVWLVDKLARHRAVLLADDAGLGKTRETLAAAQQMGLDRILIVCPAGARRVWQNEIHRWVPSWDDRVVLVEPGTKLSNIQPRLNNTQPIILIVGYDELSNLKSRIAFALKLVRWDLLVLDEAHYLKNPANRTRAIYGFHAEKGLEARADRVILLTGTPTPNHAGELWQHYRVFWPQAVQRTSPGGVTRPLTQFEFEERYTRYRDTVFGRQIVGSKNQGELRDALSQVVLRRRKAEVLPELPPLQLQDIALIYTPTSGDAIRTRAMAGLDQLLADAVTDTRLLAALRTPDAGTAELRQQLGLLKVTPTLVWVQERMASTHKLLVFAWHHSVIDAMARGLVEFNPVVITGETSPKERAEAIDGFQNNSNVRIFIGQILAAGTAITLTAAQEVAIVEPSWVPGENVQAICRAHRLGQRDSVLASFLYLPGTLDERIMRVFRRKAAEIGQLQGDDDADPSQHDLRPGKRGRADDVRAVRTAGSLAGTCSRLAGHP